VSARKRNDPFRRFKTRHRGVHFRLKKDGSRSYYFFADGTYVAVEGGEAEAVAAQAEARGKASRGEVMTRSKATFAVVAEEWLTSKRKIRAGTRKRYRGSLDNVLLPRFGKVKVGAVTVDHIAKLIRDLEKGGAAPSTIANHMKPLSGTLAFAVRRKLISNNPYDALVSDDRPARREKVEAHEWNDSEMAALIDAAERMTRQPEARADYSMLIRTALYTGLRQGELLGLTWADVDLQEGALHVRRQWLRDAGSGTPAYGPPKTQAGIRRVPLSADMVRRFKEWKLKSRYSGDDAPVFAGRDGRPLGHRNAARRGFEKARDLAGIEGEGVTFHSMRDAFASRMIARGVEPVTLAKVMGHENARITLDRYVHLYDRQRSDDRIREAMAQ
jgi:integrase